MTNEEAIKMLNTLYSTDVYVNDALDLAIKALETGEIYMTGEDYNLYMEGYKAGKKDFEPKQGEWILQYRSCGDAYYTCSLCNRAVEVDNGYSLKDYPFCHCGAKMGGAE